MPFNEGNTINYEDIAKYSQGQSQMIISLASGNYLWNGGSDLQRNYFDVFKGSGNFISAGIGWVSNTIVLSGNIATGSVIWNGKMIDNNLKGAVIFPQETLNTGSISYYFSANSGANWEESPKNSYHFFSNLGSFFKLKTHFMSGTGGGSPALINFDVHIIA